MPQFQVGQRWSYQVRAEENRESTFVIGAVDTDANIIHISVEKAFLSDATEPVSIGHMPFSGEALTKSVVELLGNQVQVDKGFAEGLAHWKANRGGIFQITVSDAITAIISAQKPSTPDLFDELVRKMQAGRSPELAAELYRSLFALEEWFFLCELDKDETPMQWDFNIGGQSSPAILAFTSAEKAIAAADKLNLYPTETDIRLMPADIDKAIIWLDSENCHCTWVCFNVTHQQFPLYIADAVRMNLKR
ncbi:hypothetical protein Lepto7376_2605 [[Leptolyngbya] sp. PCC 7376]|uniref:hypothetical protein n=1 Tax=[Leptolyngbya] sp. PCC 7376 TaxID=111781 RepID=UPI00029F45E2|nr:hypothetical protein [[Leptolyngbya] sp. PCC 7376]AFY38876.1 hypothetical protein Lepto7376_2605 [[Leptolyngbya] sp. PCC 7376]